MNNRPPFVCVVIDSWWLVVRWRRDGIFARSAPLPLVGTETFWRTPRMVTSGRENQLRQWTSLKGVCKL